jgi:hypothetical protein
MPGSGTMASVIKGPKGPLNFHGIQYVAHPHNFPTHPPREPRRSHAMPRKDESFSLMVHGPFNHNK